MLMICDHSRRAAGRGEAVCGISPFGLWSSALSVRAELAEPVWGQAAGSCPVLFM